MTTDFRALCAELTATLAERINDKGDAGSYYVHAAHLLIRARAALADEPAVLDGREPASVAGQPSDGEVAELAAWLRERATWCTAEDSAHKKYDRAAELLERLSPPQPVPVSERLPGPEDCDANGRCWIGQSEYTFPMGDTGRWGHADPEWCLGEPPSQREAANSTAVWLPAHALPLPEVGE